MTSPLADRLRALAPQDDDSDWPDVRRRARRRGRTPMVIAAAVLAAALAVAPAFGLHRVVLDFFSGDPAPADVRLDFERLGVGAPRGMDPRVVSGQTRRVPLAGDGAEHRLWVAPTRSGGFCYRFDFFGSCRAERQGRALGVGYVGNQWMTRVHGTVVSQDADRIELRYADGETATAPITWVSEPIDAGFFYVDVPAVHRTPETRLVEVVLVDGDGDVLARERPPYQHPLFEDDPATGLPKAVVYEQKRTLVTISTSDGKEISAVRAPSRLGGSCTWLERGGELHRAFFGCQTEAQQERQRPSGLGLMGGSKPVLFWAMGRNVARVELRFEDGATRQVDAFQGVVLTEIEPERYDRGRRLVEAVAFGPFGEEVARNRLDPTSGGTYPCEEPAGVGAGVKMCP